MGELETTLKSDIERLKAFITDGVDEYRLPYDRSDTRLPRRTSFIATCNSAKFLIDPTGSRRFWTVPTESIDLDALKKLDVLQVWKQVEKETADNPQSFRLTPEEQKELAKRNKSHDKPLPAQDEIEDILEMAECNPDKYKFDYITVTNFKESYIVLSKFNTRQVSMALETLGIKKTRKKKNGASFNGRKLPIPIEADPF